MVLLGGWSARAQPATAPNAAPPASATAAAPRSTLQLVLPLSRLIGSEAPVRLAGVASDMRFSLPVPALWRADEVQLELAGTASQALIESSQLEVSLNGRVVQQLRLDGRTPEFRHLVNVPTALLRPGFNEVKLAVAQHYTTTCEYPMAPQLWTQIDPAASRLRISASPRQVPLRLDRLDALFDKAGWDEAPLVSVLTANTPSAEVMSAMGLVAQGVGQRFDYVPVRIASGRYPADMAALGSALPQGSRGAVVLGTFEQLRSYLAGLGIPADSGPVAAVRALPADPTRFAFILAARNEADLSLVAGAFAMQRMPWPDSAWAAVRDLKMPPLGSVTGAAATLKPATNAFPLSALGYRTTTYTGMQGRGATMRFWNANWQGRVQVRVHTSYAAGMSPQSALNVLANGALHGSIPLDNPAGGVYENYAVTVPAGALRPGWNTLELQPVLVPRSNGGECQPFFVGNLAATVYDDSTMQAFGGSPLKRPDLALLARDGRAIPTAPVGLGMAVQLTDAEDPTLGAGLTLMAKLTQVFRGPLLRTTFGVGANDEATNRLWVGSLERLPASLRQAAGLSDPGRLVAPVPLIQSVKVRVIEGGDTLMQLSEALDRDGSRPVTLAAEATLENAFADHGIAATAFDGDVPVTVFTATTPAAVLAGVHEVIGYGAWAQLAGHLAVWRPDSDTMHTVSAEDAPFTAYSLRGGLGLWVSQYPWWSLLILLVFIAAMVLLTRVVLAGYRRRNLPPQVGLRRDDEVPK